LIDDDHSFRREFIHLAFTPMLHDDDAPPPKDHEYEDEVEQEMAGGQSRHNYVKQSEVRKVCAVVGAVAAHPGAFLQTYIRCFEGIKPERSLTCALCKRSVSSA